ncbi:PAP2 domain-containing protein [Pyronema domesticum]|uniref:Similar to Diacylglycerol pyrophosphate phosphatase 1 acc. no. Q05521 n=1 Tax=Pyronema omphalodes (strain CBS 100304) TaxID=1076935 RepID=U4L989_PYROM|nr:PAP2 domain-containing protein [Pyronema domesticum]CCX10131.1 Similar to Diacylglycerol pyrophosphate phosphatase 1; acc. no. Q05521 [Pyronema omphalodes CBS 100304]
MPATTRLKSKERAPEPGFTGAIRRMYTRAYGADWFGVLLLVLQNLALLFVVPFKRLFSLDDRRISFPHADPERVPVPQLLFYAAALPAIVITLYIIVAPSATAKSHKLHVALLGLTTSLLLAAFITDLIKNTVGRGRPDLLARCKAAEGTPLHELVDWTVCTETDHHTLHDGFRSFPSGHSSFSWAGLGYLGLFLAGQMAALKRGRGIGRLVVAGLPAVGAALITISRTEDYRHDVFDVSVGTWIGMGCAWFMYRRYFRALGDVKCEMPYEREEEEGEKDEDGFERLREVEMGVRTGRTV